MKLQNILSDIEQVDPEVYERLNSRRGLLNLGGKLAAAALPLAFGSSLKKAYAQTSTNNKIVDVLNFALTLEYLEAEFYNIGMGTPGLIPAEDRLIFAEVQMHENAHVAFLRKVLQSLGARPVEKPRFDFTAKGTFPTVFSSYTTYKLLAQAFEDTGVRAYKGQAGNLVGTGAVLEAALNIHSVEARHAAYIRRLNGNKGWVTFADSTGLPAAIYAGEDQQIQNERLGPINAHSGPVLFGIDTMAVTESFDEPLTKEQVLAIAMPFIVG
ncbi:ferritin-like domain-containing protein [Tellurirhabdus rosea]|uniref:ferritin-like domain-containing protein n=1 Tax=Tellurirhabdus rosea TaxID=2674997 RepID=UPI002251F0ED|nr:ferritin-like domain-containing protein [Tellurirhabdus rosea]